jgi:lysophospholipase L1-like esterase
MRSLTRNGMLYVLGTTSLVAACTTWGTTGSMTNVAPGSEATAAPTGSSEATGSLALRYVALGDSYTIGTSVGEAERWPNQLSERVPGLRLVANLGVNGFTSADTIDVELPRLGALDPQIVTLLIGVNDVVQGVPPETYRRNVEAILDDLVARVGASRVLVVTTPDYTVTPVGADYGDPARQSAAIREANRVLAAAAAARGVAVVDISDISLRAKGDRSLVASDGLHPSGEQYRFWVDRIAPAIAELVAKTEAP